MNKIKRNPRRFTLIELLVVIAIIGILVLLALPKFNNYMDEAHLTRIQSDIKVTEGLVEETLMNNNYKFPNEWESVNVDELTNTAQENKLYHVKGLVEDENIIEDGEYVILSTGFTNTKLKGNFYANQGGKVYYEDTKRGNIDEGIEESNEPSDVDLGMENDFEWVPNSEPGSYEAINMVDHHIVSSAQMFRNSKAIIGYAKTQEDANKLNEINIAYSEPAELTFTVK